MRILGWLGYHLADALVIYFRTYARSIGCNVDSLGDLAVWTYIIQYKRTEVRGVAYGLPSPVVGMVFDR